MVAYATSLVADAAFSTIKNNVSVITVTFGLPDTYASAISGTQVLASAVVTTGVFTIGSHASGRQLTVSQITGASVTTTGGGNHVCLIDKVASTFYYATTATSQQLTAGNALTINGFSLVIKNPNQ
jgi:hypothetical protein